MSRNVAHRSSLFPPSPDNSATLAQVGAAISTSSGPLFPWLLIPNLLFSDYQATRVLSSRSAHHGLRDSVSQLAQTYASNPEGPSVMCCSQTMWPAVDGIPKPIAQVPSGWLREFTLFSCLFDAREAIAWRIVSERLVAHAADHRGATEGSGPGDVRKLILFERTTSKGFLLHLRR